MDRSRVFCRKKFENVIADGDDRIVHFWVYHGKHGHGEKLKDPGDFEKEIWRLKDCIAGAVNLFAERVDCELERDVAVCVVPSHKARPRNTSGISQVARKLVAKGRYDAVDALIRLKSVEKLEMGGMRDLRTHYDSVICNPEVNLGGKIVVLLDDVTTTGNSLIACRNILLKQSGAARCVMVALGQTDRRYYPKNWREWNMRRWKQDEPLEKVVLQRPVQIYLGEAKRIYDTQGKRLADRYKAQFGKFIVPPAADYEYSGRELSQVFILSKYAHCFRRLMRSRRMGRVVAYPGGVSRRDVMLVAEDV